MPQYIIQDPYTDALLGPFSAEETITRLAEISGTTVFTIEPHTTKREVNRLVDEARRMQNIAPRPTGANGMTESDTICHALSGRIGIVRHFVQDGDALVDWQDGSTSTVKWNHLSKVHE